MQYNFAALDRDHLEEAEDEIRMLIRSYRHLASAAGRHLRRFNPRTRWSRPGISLTGAIAGAAVGIVSVFMVVGGVVIMNIMLAVVTERTREIGVRKSVGARSQDILNQFLVESSMLSGIGGLIGVTIAWLIGAHGAQLHAGAHGGSAERRDHRRGAVRRGRLVLRNLSGAAGGAPGPDRGLAGGES